MNSILAYINRELGLSSLDIKKGAVEGAALAALLLGIYFLPCAIA